jgi:hypothetical protein
MLKTAIQIGSNLKIQIEEEDFITFMKKVELFGLAAKKSGSRNVCTFQRETAKGGFMGFVDTDTGEELTLHTRREGKGYYLTPSDQYEHWRNQNDQGDANDGPQDDAPDDRYREEPQNPPPRQQERRPAPAAPARTQRQGPPPPPRGGSGW